MKTIRSWLKTGRLSALALALAVSGGKVSAQTDGSNLIPVVTVQATQPVATLADPGVFTVFRAGNTDATLNVWYDLAGTASNGVDYALIPPHLVSIAVGTFSNTIIITPLNGVPPASVAKTVVLALTNSPMMNPLTPVNYQIGSPSSAVVYVAANGATNLPPLVSIIAPSAGSVYYTPTNVQILARATSLAGTITNVEFFAGATDLGTGTPLVLDPPGVGGVTGLVYRFTWINPPPGNYPLTAVATDNGGASTVSSPVNISALQGPPPNLPPVVRIISPANGRQFFAPVNIPIFAYAQAPGGLITSVEFFAGTNSLGFGQRLPVVTPLAAGGIIIGGPVPPFYPTNVFFLTWSNAPVGAYVLTAEATDNAGASAVSDPVNIAVLPSPPPPTNRPPVISIMASDPVAIAGTNGWVWPGETNATPTWAAWPIAGRRFFTNCGPKTATFTVRRWGDTNDAVTVAYGIGGTASNGVDYVALPGVVTVPAGDDSALITIVPIDRNLTNTVKTVVLSLAPATNTPPDYVLGFPRRAAAIIVERAGPCPATDLLPGNYFHFTAQGPDTAWFCIETSPDLVNWTPVCTNQVVNGAIDFVDPNGAGNAQQFYRAVPLNGAP